MHREHREEAVSDQLPLRSRSIPRRSGEVVAALVSLWLGMAALTATHWWSAADPARANPRLLHWGAWMPGGLLIGPFAGKETAALVVWLGSWLLLFWPLKRYDGPLKLWTGAFLVGAAILLVLLWPPVYHRLYGWPV